MKKILFAIAILFATTLVAQQHPNAFANKQEFAFVKDNITKTALLQQSYADLKASVDAWLGKDIDVPVPKDPAGGYTHEKHKANYNLMFHAGLMYNITGDARYALLVKNMFLKYAALVPTLANHPEATSSSPGRIFWQALNDANYLVYAGLAYDLIQPYLTEVERKTISEGAFKPEVDYFTKDLSKWFDLIHNHAVWACAGVGIVGIATDNQDYIDMALYGSSKDKSAGFLAHLNGLFSPDGYYNEGPYYTRYAVLPFYFFANALNHAKPELKIFQYRDQILGKALKGALEQTNLDGAFYSYNDAIKDKTYTSNEVVYAVDIYWQVYGASADLLPIAKVQDRVIMSKGGVEISKKLDDSKSVPAYYPYKSIEFTDGPKGDEGGVAVIRSGKGKNLTSLIYKYSTHGLSHGHYDKLNINLYDNGNEILQDYGAVRFIGIEQKYGGRYLPQTKDYAQQTIAHNTVTVDEKSHFNGKESESQKNHPTKWYSKVDSTNVQVVTAFEDKAYKDVNMQRSVFVIKVPGASKPLILDIFRLLSATEHQYDLPFNYLGYVISTNYKYESYKANLKPLGKKNGYQFMWKEAGARIGKEMSQFTFLNDKRFYTVSSVSGDSAEIFFTVLGANDPDFNLRRDPSYVIRTKGTNKTYVNAIEIHGDYSTINEVASGAYSAVADIKVLQDDAAFTAVEVSYNSKPLLAISVNSPAAGDKTFTYNYNGKAITWKGNYYIQYDNKLLNK